MTTLPQRLEAWRTALFAVVIFAGSCLLFMVQPMVARMALPMLGGAPNVWNSALLVFQLLLLGGYAYAFALSWLRPGLQLVIHIGLLLVSLATLPIDLADLPRPAPGWEFVWVPALFLLTIGPVFFLLSAHSSLLQNWFAAGSPGANPYRLYVASNLGSFVGLLAYPFWIEAQLTLSSQSLAWSAGYAAVALAVALLMLAQRKREGVRPAQETAHAAERPTWRRIALWLALAAVPSGLMLSTTTLLTTDLMAMPLLWVIPLGLYLLSFTVAFSDRGLWTGILSGYAPFLLLLVGGMGMISGGQSNPAIALAMVALLFVLAVALHGRLYRERPAPGQLTLFYLVIAAGGALGGVFTALVAPLVFDWVYEHALLLLAAALLIPHHQFVAPLRRLWSAGRTSWIVAAVLLLVAAVLSRLLAGAVQSGAGEAILLLATALIVIGIAAIGRRAAYAAILACLMLGLGGTATLSTSFAGSRTRSYFGVYSVVPVEDGKLLRLVHGTTMHGEQWLDPTLKDEPTGYYTAQSGVGLVLAEAASNARVGIVGLGVGTLACYRRPGQRWTFFEIDPAVIAFSRSRTFTFLADCAPDARIVTGDARLSLAGEPADSFDALAIDAFTSDAIPIHLLTREAFDTYGRTLANDGVLLLHISNRFFDLAPMVAALARAGGWSGRIRRQTEASGPGQSPSIWIALSRSPAALDRLEQSGPGKWEPLPAPAAQPWRDDHASLFQLFGG